MSVYMQNPKEPHVLTRIRFLPRGWVLSTSNKWFRPSYSRWNRPSEHRVQTFHFGPFVLMKIKNWRF